MSAFPVWLSDPKYNLLRSTTMGIIIKDDAQNIVSNGRYIEYDDTRYGLYHVRIALKQKFYDWSSNYYTLDYIWSFEEFQLWLNGIEISTFGIFAWANIKEDKFGLFLYISLFTPLPYQQNLISLPSAPAGYWLPVSG